MPVGDQAENLEHQGGAHQGGIAGLVVWRSDFHDIAADEVQSAKTAQQALRFCLSKIPQPHGRHMSAEM